MEDCKLCRSRKANQTGSHIFTYSLIKSAINEVGETVRGKELTFGISSTEFFSLYFGQKIMPETIEDVLGKEITEEDIGKNENPFIVDNIVCVNCEKLFTPVEDFFFTKIQTPISEDKFPLSNNKTYGSHFELDEESSLLVRLYFYIQIWRASVSGETNCILDSYVEEKLHKILNRCLQSDLKDVKEECIKNKDLINKFPIILTHLKTSTDDKANLTTNLVFIDPIGKPSFYILNQFIFQFYFQPKHTNDSKKSHYGLTDILKDHEAFNFKNEKLIINQISEEERLKILELLLLKVKNETVKNFSRDFSYYFLKRYGQLPTKKIILAALNSYVSQYKV